jgi:hypothetical protein
MESPPWLLQGGMMAPVDPNRRDVVYFLFSSFNTIRDHH